MLLSYCTEQQCYKQHMTGDLLIYWICWQNVYNDIIVYRHNSLLTESPNSVTFSGTLLSVCDHACLSCRVCIADP